MRIGRIDTEDRVVVVAEVGNNHEGDVDLALRLVDAAADAGADAVKFQTFRPEHFLSRADAERFARYERFALGAEQFASLAERARERGLAFVSTPLDLGSAAMLESLVDAYKIASGDNMFWPLIARVLETGKPVIVSTGLLDAEGVGRVVAFVEERWGEERTSEHFALLQCVTAYPAQPEEVSLGAIRTLGARHGVTVGYSDHTLGIVAAVLSVAAGARIVEKHFTLDRGFSDFRDHALSADPAEFRRLVSEIRTAETLYGETEKRQRPSEARAESSVRRSVVAAVDLPAGHRLVDGDLEWVRPGGGLEPGRERDLIGRTLVRPLAAGERIAASDVR